MLRGSHAPRARLLIEDSKTSRSNWRVYVTTNAEPSARVLPGALFFYHNDLFRPSNMLLKKSTIVLCSSNNLSPTWFSPSIAPSYSPRGSPTERQRILSRNWLHARGYAAVHHGGGDKKSSGHGHFHGPSDWPTSMNPTPYEIFGQQKSAPYSKTAFYDLVKIYHPDRHHYATPDGISRATKLARYHLIVVAHNILSDPAKRRAYDLYGAGWGQKPDTIQDTYRNADRTWREEPGNASMNATWEDWEQWYQRRDGKKQEPVFVSNGGFVAVLLMFVCLGGFGQATRARAHSLNLLDLRDQKHEAVSRGLRQRYLESAALSKEDRVESFLRQREGLS